jgi:hypothetical protein
LETQHQRVPLRTLSLYQADLHPVYKDLVLSSCPRSHQHQPISRRDQLLLLAQAEPRDRTSFKGPSSKACLIQALQFPNPIGKFKAEGQDISILDRTTRMCQPIRVILNPAIPLASRMSLMNRDIQDLDTTHISRMFQAIRDILGLDTIHISTMYQPSWDILDLVQRRQTGLDSKALCPTSISAITSISLARMLIRMARLHTKAILPKKVRHPTKAPSTREVPSATRVPCEPTPTCTVTRLNQGSKNLLF